MGYGLTTKPEAPKPEDAAALVCAGFRVWNKDEDDWKKILANVFGKSFSALKTSTDVPLQVCGLKAGTLDEMFMPHHNECINEDFIFIKVCPEKKYVMAVSPVVTEPNEEIIRLEDVTHEWMYEIYRPRMAKRDSLTHAMPLDGILSMVEHLDAIAGKEGGEEKA